MKIWELEWTEGRMYKASNGQILKVDSIGNLIDYYTPHKILCNLDFEPYIDWDEVAIDAKVWVSNDGKGWQKRYFSKYADGKVYAFANGQTEWTSDGWTNEWNYAKLVEEVE